MRAFIHAELAMIFCCGYYLGSVVEPFAGGMVILYGGREIEWFSPCVGYDLVCPD